MVLLLLFLWPVAYGLVCPCHLPKARCGGFPVTYNLHSSFVSSVVKRLHLYLISAAHNQSCKLLNQRGLAKSDSNSTATRQQIDINSLTPIHPDAILESETVHPKLCAGAPTPAEPPGVNGLQYRSLTTEY